LLGAWESHAGLGDVLVSAGFTLERNPDTVRGPDVSFVRKGAFRMALPPAATPRSVRTPRSRSVRPTTPGPSWSPRRKSIWPGAASLWCSSSRMSTLKCTGRSSGPSGWDRRIRCRPRMSCPASAAG